MDFLGPLVILGIPSTCHSERSEESKIFRFAQDDSDEQHLITVKNSNGCQYWTDLGYS